MTRYREEKDSMGIVRVPTTAYYGAQTQRAADNFPVSGLRMPPHFIRSLALIKECAGLANQSLGLLDAEPAGAIAAAARLAQAAASPIDDLRASADYRRAMVATLVERALTQIAAGRARAGWPRARGATSSGNVN